ncbi:MAG: TetR/AcrR family transcriptional regulator [Flavobacteriaceae bacterium TMED121]|mgnify:FL=1|nr:MAG: TetR/AcrR family transcriptional regulator [Flavobacteriaceae bacterium TMED121]|tara:strand:- start:1465 stop:2076 length:612 start_codon:yes stop_codon:yes gene_type:complete
MEKEIVKNAAYLFLQYGYKSVTMDDLAEHMGISKKTIYTYFNDKISLIRSSVWYIFEEVKTKIIGVQESMDNPIEALYEIKKIAVEVLGNKDKSPQYQLQKYYPSIYSEIRKKELSALGNSFEMSLKKGMKSGLFRPSLDTHFITLIYFNGFRGLRDIELFPPDEYDIDQIIGKFIDYHLRAIVTSKGLNFLENYNTTKSNEN